MVCFCVITSKEKFHMTSSTLYLLKGLSEEQKEYVMVQMTKKEKDTTMAYFYWIWGIHYVCFKKPLKCILFAITVGGLGIWWIIDLFRVRSMVEDANIKIVQELIAEAKNLDNHEMKLLEIYTKKDRDKF